MANDSASNEVSNNGLYYNIFNPQVNLWQPVYQIDTPVMPEMEIETQLNPVTASTPTPLSKQAEAMVAAILGMVTE